MAKGIRRLYRDAVEAARASIPDIARECGYSLPTVQQYLYQRTPSPEAVRRLADALEARAGRLLEHARRLRKAAGGDDHRAVPASPSRRR